MATLAHCALSRVHIMPERVFHDTIITPCQLRHSHSLHIAFHLPTSSASISLYIWGEILKYSCQLCLTKLINEYNQISFGLLLVDLQVQVNCKQLIFPNIDANIIYIIINIYCSRVAVFLILIHNFQSHISCTWAIMRSIQCQLSFPGTYFTNKFWLWSSMHR